MKLLLDEMMPRAIAEQLRIRGHNAELVVDWDPLRTKSDEIIWAAARAESRTIVTEDTDYRVFIVELALLGDPHPGIIFTSPRSLPRTDPGTVGRIVAALDELLTSGINLTNREYWLA